MLIRILVGSFLSAIAMLAWGFVYWGLLPIGEKVILKFPQGTRLTEIMDEEKLDSGVYRYPDMGKTIILEEEREDDKGRIVVNRWPQPIVHLFFNREVIEEGFGLYFLGFLHYFAASLLACAALSIAIPILHTYGSRVGFVFVIGLFGAVWLQLANPIWFQNPLGYFLALAAYNIFGALVMGLVLGYFLKPGLPGGPEAR